MPFVRLRSQLLPIGAPAGACPRRHLLTGRPWRLLEASCTLGPRSAPALFRHFLGPSVDGPFLVDCAGGIRTHGLELMRLAGTAAPLPRYLAGWSRTSALRLPKPAGWPSSPTASCPSSRRPWNRTTLDRHIRAAPRRSACRRCLSAKRESAERIPAARIPALRAGHVPERPFGAATAGEGHRRRQGIAPCSTGSRPEGSLTSLATQSRREESNPRASTVGAWRSSIELRREALSTGIEPASPGRQPGRVARRAREHGVGAPLVPHSRLQRPAVFRRPTAGSGHASRQLRPTADAFRDLPRPQGRDPSGEQTRAPSGIRTRVAGLRGRHPRSARRPGRVSCDGWARTSILRVTAGRPADWTTSHR